MMVGGVNMKTDLATPPECIEGSEAFRRFDVLGCIDRFVDICSATVAKSTYKSL